MGFDFRIFGDGRLDERYLEWLVNERSMDLVLYYEKLWGYYRNEMSEGDGAAYGEREESSRPYRQVQEYGLPSRITGVRYGTYGGLHGAERVRNCTRKEVVIENDIGWRIHAMVDFLFGKPLGISSRAKDPKRAEEIGAILRAVFEKNGGVRLFQEMSLLGSVYGFVDVVLRWGERIGTGQGASAGVQPKPFSEVLERAQELTFEAIDAPRSLPILDEQDYRTIRYYVQSYWQLHNRLEDRESLVKNQNRFGRRVSRQKETHNVEVIGRDVWQRYEDMELAEEGMNPLGVIPVVHIQNMPLPLHYEGQSDVEPLIPLQDELNTRLSDRANRITFQSFKMYLGKGIEGFENRVVTPGRMWSTENEKASIEEFGGDPGSPSEEEHLKQIREAMDKASGVASIAAGILKGRIGNLTSAVALKMTLMGVLAKTERKRITYGRGIREMCELVLLALDRLGVYPNGPEEREVEVNWPSPLPENLTEKLEEALMKKELGVPQEQLLRELGYENVQR